MALNIAQAGKFPVISHPLSRLGSRESLSIHGSGRHSDGIQSVEPRLNLHTAMEIDRSKSMMKRSSTSQENRRVSTEEVVLHLQDKLSSNLPSARKIFQANDPFGEGTIPKEAFPRVMWLLYGYLSSKQIQSILKSIGLDRKDSISFEEFYFRVKNHGLPDSPYRKVSKWVKAVSTAPGNKAKQQDRPSLPPSTPRSARSTRGAHHAPGESAERCWNTLKRKVQNEQFDPTAIFPAICFGDGAFVVPAQFREALRKLSINADEDDVTKIYRSMEGASPYAVHTSRLFELLGLDPESGRFRPPKTSILQAKHDETNQMIPAPKAITPNERTPEPEPKRPRTAHEVSPNDERRRSVVRPRTCFNTSSLFEGDVAMLISKKLEEGHSSLLNAMEARDSEHRGEITKADLRFALARLGIPVKATDMEHFLVRNGLRRKDQRVNYKLLMRRLQTRSNRGLLHKVMKNKDHTFHRVPTPIVSPDGVSAPTLEALLLDVFQKEFLELLALIKARDFSETGVIALVDLRDALQTRCNVVFTDNSWNAFVASPFMKLVPPPAGISDKELYVGYNDLLSKFDVMIRPATADEDDPWLQSNIDNEYAHLHEHKRRYLLGMGADPANHTLRHDPRPIEELEKVMVDIFVNKFHTMKKEYDMIVREDFCRVDKEKFDYVMFRCGFILTASELSRLWLSLPITRPIESMSFPGLLRHALKLHYSATKPGRFTRNSSDMDMVSCVMNKMRQQVTSHWATLKKKFRFLDPMGTSRVAKEDMLEIVKGLKPKVMDLELHYMIEMLESRIAGKTNYFRFMEFFTKPLSRHSLRSHSTASKETPEPVLSDTTSVIALRPGPPPVPTRQHNFVYKRKVRSPFVSLRNAPATPVFKTVTRHDLLKRGPKNYPHRYDKENAIKAGFYGRRQDQTISVEEANHLYRSNVADLVRHPPSVSSTIPLSEPPTFYQISPKQIPALRRSLRAVDVAQRGKISVNAFRRVLQEYGVTFQDPNQLFDFLRHYDTKLSDQVSYERFLQNIIPVA